MTRANSAVARPHSQRERIRSAIKFAILSATNEKPANVDAALSNFMSECERAIVAVVGRPNHFGLSQKSARKINAGVRTILVQLRLRPLYWARKREVKSTKHTLNRLEEYVKKNCKKLIKDPIERAAKEKRDAKKETR